MKNKKKIYTPKGEELTSIEEIREYIMTKNFTLREMRKSPYFAMQFENGDLSDYNRIAENIKLRDQDGNIIEDEEIYYLLKEAENTQLIEELTKNFAINIPKNEGNLVELFKNMLIKQLKYIQQNPSDSISTYEYLQSVATRIMQLPNIDSIKKELIRDENLEKIRKISRGIVFKRACEKLQGAKSDDGINIDEIIKELESLLERVEKFNKKEAEMLVSEAYLDAEYIKNTDTDKFSFRLNKVRQELTDLNKKKVYDEEEK